MLDVQLFIFVYWCLDSCLVFFTKNKDEIMGLLQISKRETRNYIAFSCTTLIFLILLILCIGNKVRSILLKKYVVNSNRFEKVYTMFHQSKVRIICKSTFFST